MKKKLGVLIAGGILAAGCSGEASPELEARHASPPAIDAPSPEADSGNRIHLLEVGKTIDTHRILKPKAGTKQQLILQTPQNAETETLAIIYDAEHSKKMGEQIGMPEIYAGGYLVGYHEGHIDLGLVLFEIDSKKVVSVQPMIDDVVGMQVIYEDWRDDALLSVSVGMDGEDGVRVLMDGTATMPGDNILQEGPTGDPAGGTIS